MKEQIGLGAFGTFGEPFGYQQVFFLTTAIQSQLDLNTNAIEVYPGSELYAIKRETTEGISTVCCCLYTYAKEPASNRGGTFIGTCVVLHNCFLKGEAIYTLLKELHTDVISNPKNIIDNTLQVQKAEQLTVTEPASFNRIKTTAAPVHPSKIVAIDGQSKFLIQAPANVDGMQPVAAFFDTAAPYFTHTDTLYFTTDVRIVRYTTEKGIIPNVSWDAFQDYKKQIVQQQKEAAQKVSAAKKVERPTTEKGIKNTVKTKPVSSKTYGLLEPWTNVDINFNKESFYKMVQNHNALLQEYLKLSQQQVATIAISGSNGNHQPATSKRRHRIKRKHLLFTIGVLFALLLTTSILLLIRPAATSSEVAPSNLSVTDSTIPDRTPVVPPSLAPVSNTELSKADVVKLAKDSLTGKKIEVIVDLIFIRNPKSVGEVYAGQKEAYAASLLQLNEKCFQMDSNETTCTCDTLLHVPALKK